MEMLMMSNSSCRYTTQASGPENDNHQVQFSAVRREFNNCTAHSTLNTSLKVERKRRRTMSQN